MWDVASWGLWPKILQGHPAQAQNHQEASASEDSPAKASSANGERLLTLGL